MVPVMHALMAMWRGTAQSVPSYTRRCEGGQARPQIRLHQSHPSAPQSGAPLSVPCAVIKTVCAENAEAKTVESGRASSGGWHLQGGGTWSEPMWWRTGVVTRRGGQARWSKSERPAARSHCCKTHSAAIAARLFCVRPLPSPFETLGERRMVVQRSAALRPLPPRPLLGMSAALPISTKSGNIVDINIVVSTLAARPYED